MKKLLIAALCLLLLCSCATVPVETAAPTNTAATTAVTTAARATAYDETPALSETAVTIHGTALQALYESNGTLLLPLHEFAALLDGTVTQTENADGSFSGTLTWQDAAAGFDNSGTVLRWQEQDVTLPQRCLYDGSDWYLPAVELLTAAGYTRYDDTEKNHLYFTLLPDLSLVPEDCEVPVLMYHAVSDTIWSGSAELFVSPSSLEEQLQYLNDNGYSAIWFEDLPNVAQYEKPVILTFDDGYRDNYEELFPLLQKYNIKATIFCVPGSIGQEHTMEIPQMKELSDSGLVSIQSHTYTHKHLTKLDAQTLDMELSRSQLLLTRITGKQPYVLCYPYGDYNDAVIANADDYYQMGIVMTGRTFKGNASRFHVGRSYISRYTSLSQFADYIS